MVNKVYRCLPQGKPVNIAPRWFSFAVYAFVDRHIQCMDGRMTSCFYVLSKSISVTPGDLEVDNERSLVAL